MYPHTLVALVTLLALVLYLGLCISAGRARAASGIQAPAMTGDARLERALRVQYNTLEWLPIFLGGLWLFALYGSDLVAALLGLVWIAARLAYAVLYMANPAKRGPAFGLQAAAALILLVGALGRVIYVLVVLRA